MAPPPTLAELCVTAIPGTPALEKRVHVCGRLHHVLRDVQLRDRVSDLPPPRGTRRTRHHDLIEPESLRLKREVVLRGSAGAHRNLEVAGGVPDPLCAERVVARRNVQDDEPSIVTRQRSQARIDQVYLNRSERTLGRAVGDLAGHRTVLCAGRHGHGQCRGKEEKSSLESRSAPSAAGFRQATSHVAAPCIPVSYRATKGPQGISPRAHPYSTGPRPPQDAWAAG